MSTVIVSQWRDEFIRVVRRGQFAGPLKEAALGERLGEWTSVLTSVAIETCRESGWDATAKGHASTFLPIRGSEYLGIDVMAFERGTQRWRFPAAAIELENQLAEDRIAYSLWKVLSIRAPLRIVFCYRRREAEGLRLIQHLAGDVIATMPVLDRIDLKGELAIVVGSRSDAGTFPYGFFRWWALEPNTGELRPI